MLELLRKGQITLRERDSLPSLPEVEQFDKEIPPFSGVVNRLKVIANLDPVWFKEPKQGKIYLAAPDPAEGRVFDYVVRAIFVDDRQERSVQLQVEERKPAPVEGRSAWGQAWKKS